MEWEERHDPIEDDPAFSGILELVDQEADEKSLAELNEFQKEKGSDFRFDETNFPMGYCFTFWHHKKRILKERYGIDWQSPDELNPYALYD